MSSRCICVIPARMASTRFPGKPLKTLLGLPMIHHIYERCRLYKGFDTVVVATCDLEIYESITNNGGSAVMTKKDHERCTDRVEEAIKNLKIDLSGNDLVVMVQGDEILINPDMLKSVTEIYFERKPTVINLISRISSEEDQNDVNTVKVVTDLTNRVLFMSRAAIPSRARLPNHDNVFQQTGLIAFSAENLRKFSQLPQTPLEKIESVDMMRFIEHGYSILAVKTDIATIGVDTQSDLIRAEQALLQDPWTKMYLSMNIAKKEKVASNKTHKDYNIL